MMDRHLRRWFNDFSLKQKIRMEAPSCGNAMVMLTSGELSI